MYKKKKEDEVFLVLLGHGPRPSVRRVRGSLLPSFDPHQRCRLDDCREQSVCPTAEDLVPSLREANGVWDSGGVKTEVYGGVGVGRRSESLDSFGRLQIAMLHRDMP